MRNALGQINSTVGDLAGNVNCMIEYARQAERGRADVVVFPELSITGYPPRDLVKKHSFLEHSERELERLARETAGMNVAIICGYVGRSDSPAGKRATNSAAVLVKGEIVFRQTKMLRPTYDLFDD